MNEYGVFIRIIIVTTAFIALAYLAVKTDNFGRKQELQAQIMAIKGIGFDTHPSWNCSEEFRAGWKACREQVEEAIK